MSRAAREVSTGGAQEALEEATTEDVRAEASSEEHEDEDMGAVDEDDLDSSHAELVMRWLRRWTGGSEEERSTKEELTQALSLPVTVPSAPAVRRPVEEVLHMIRCVWSVYWCLWVCACADTDAYCTQCVEGAPTWYCGVRHCHRGADGRDGWHASSRL